MTTERNLIEVSGMSVEVVRKDIKHLHLAVYPPNGRIRVAAPLRLEDEDVRLAVVSRLRWIRRKQTALRLQDRQSEREFVTGESHYFKGRRYRLQVVDGFGSGVQARGNTLLELRVRPNSDAGVRERVVNDWYRRELMEMLPALVAKWEPIVGEEISEVRIKRMRTRWGSCSANARRIWLNLELIKKPTRCLEYVLVHEMAHLRERHHNDRFLDLMDQFMPTWRLHRDELNQQPLARENWRY